MKQNNGTIIFLCVCALLIFIIVLATSAPSSEEDTEDAAPVAPAVETTTSTAYTLAEVAKHASVKSCWTVVRGAVYDVTPWIAQHPGGKQTILSMCGIDATSAFNDQHEGARRPEQELASFKIGSLKQ